MPWKCTEVLYGELFKTVNSTLSPTSMFKAGPGDCPFIKNCCFVAPTKVLSPQVTLSWNLTVLATESEARLNKERSEEEYIVKVVNEWIANFAAWQSYEQVF